MIKHTMMAAALALAFAGPALAHSTKHSVKHVRADRADTSVIDRCNDMHYGEKVACLRESRSGYTDAWSAAGATSGEAGSGMTGSEESRLGTPSGSNETQPGQSSKSKSAM